MLSRSEVVSRLQQSRGHRIKPAPKIFGPRTTAECITVSIRDGQNRNPGVKAVRESTHDVRRKYADQHVRVSAEIFAALALDCEWRDELRAHV